MAPQQNSISICVGCFNTPGGASCGLEANEASSSRVFNFHIQPTFPDHHPPVAPVRGISDNELGSSGGLWIAFSSLTSAAERSTYPPPPSTHTHPSCGDDPSLCFSLLMASQQMRWNCCCREGDVFSVSSRGCPLLISTIPSRSSARKTTPEEPLDGGFVYVLPLLP